MTCNCVPVADTVGERKTELKSTARDNGMDPSQPLTEKKQLPAETVMVIEAETSGPILSSNPKLVAWKNFVSVTGLHWPIWKKSLNWTFGSSRLFSRSNIRKVSWKSITTGWYKWPKPLDLTLAMMSERL